MRPKYLVKGKQLSGEVWTLALAYVSENNTAAIAGPWRWRKQMGELAAIFLKVMPHVKIGIPIPNRDKWRDKRTPQKGYISIKVVVQSTWDEFIDRLHIDTNYYIETVRSFGRLTR